MNFYHVEDSYIAFLRQYDSKVADNKSESRPYVGVVLEIGEVKYYAPFSSPKAKHCNMKNGKDFRKIGSGRYGAINFNNMIPVPDAALIPIDISMEKNPKYKRLLQNQYRCVMADWDTIERTARELHELLTKSDEQLSGYEKRVKERCCNIMLLEQVFTKFFSRVKRNPSQ